MDASRFKDGTIVLLIPPKEAERLAASCDAVYIMSAQEVANFAAAVSEIVMERMIEKVKDEELLELKDAAKELKMTAPTLAKYSDRGEIQCACIGNRRLYRRKDLREWLEKKTPGVFKMPKSLE